MTDPTQKNSPKDSGRWERGVLEDLLLAQVKEQRRARFWGILFKAFIALYMIAILVIYMDNLNLTDAKLAGRGKHTAIVKVNGVISEDAEANAEDVNAALRAAFKDSNTAGVIIQINSPGGSPVQAGLIHDEIIRLREKYSEIPVHSVIGDVCASGGYYIAAATQNVYADKASIVGSIGVVMGGFGFVDAMEKLGVERRLMTAGEHKALLDPFSAENEKQKKHLQNMLDSIHSQFIQVVKDGRGERLSSDETLFSGLVWTGQDAIELGLVDALGGVDHVAREIIGEEELAEFSRETDVLERLADRMGVRIGEVIAEHGGLVPRLR